MKPLKRCKCGVVADTVKDLSKFVKDSSKPSGYATVCKECHKYYNWLRRNPPPNSESMAIEVEIAKLHKRIKVLRAEYKRSCLKPKEYQPTQPTLIKLSVKVI